MLSHVSFPFIPLFFLYFSASSSVKRSPTCLPSLFVSCLTSSLLSFFYTYPSYPPMFNIRFLVWKLENFVIRTHVNEFSCHLDTERNNPMQQVLCPSLTPSSECRTFDSSSQQQTSLSERPAVSWTHAGWNASLLPSSTPRYRVKLTTGVRKAPANSQSPHSRTSV